PLVPADADADSGMERLPGAKTEVPGCEIKFLVKQRVVRNVHLPIDAEHRAVRVDDHRRVVVNARGALLEEGRDNHDGVLSGEPLKRAGGRTGDRFGERKIIVVLALTEVLG